MNVGEKIRELRLSKVMTQQDLAGDQITRNMLCQIERGAALPSLPTVCYLAERLGVPVGYLLCEEKEEKNYRKMMAMPNLQKALSVGDDVACLSVIEDFFKENADDEIELIRAECEYRLARSSFSAGHLRLSAAGFDRAISAGEKTKYDTAWMRCRAAVYFRYLGQISPTLTSDLLEEGEIERSRSVEDDFCAYFLAAEALEAGRMGEVENYLAGAEGSLYAERIKGLQLMREGDFQKAAASFEKLLSREELSVGVLMYEIFGDMELCCRKNDDYKRAYEFSSSRLGLLERLLEEI